MLIENAEMNLLLTVIVSYILAGLIKLIVRYYNKQPLAIKYALGYGGMPSSHTSTVVSLTAGILLHQGFTSTFILSAVVSVIIMADAVGVRYRTGQHAKIINKLMAKNKIFKKRFNEQTGHTINQVLCGAILGIVVAIVFFII